MKRFIMAALVLSIVLGATGCGYQITEDSTVTVVRATPTPEPTPTPVATPTPEPTPTPAIVYTQTESGVNIAPMDATYVTIDGVNLRKDCSTEVEYYFGVAANTEVHVTGISEDKEWLQVIAKHPETGAETSGYIKAEYAKPADAAQ